ncbi:C40 family peptidase [Crenobacter cavernae]|uniref:Peptidoglycan endopeptidase n=1 Tax=Crenobacter cavernae TaxID=2290923 RepID=A0A345Y9J4_9NEIS|nr:C40 family peptidase [Crenobacter cavernae]AXK40596.1 peptidoglycan endopeptidase [Crenobacter cavernae]
MKLHLRLLAALLAAFMACAYAAPDKSQGDDDPISRFSSPGEEAVGDLLLQAMSLIGVAYRFGGSTPSSGLDCSGFIQYVFQKSLKVNLPRTAAEMARVGKPVDKGELVPGDLVFFNTRGFAYSHAGIYMGNGRFIHSPRTGKSVEITSLNIGYWTQRYNGARRVQRGSAASELTEKPARVERAEKPVRERETVAVSPARYEAEPRRLVESKKAGSQKPESKAESRYRKVDKAEAEPVKCKKGRRCPAVKADVADAPKSKKKGREKDPPEEKSTRQSKKRSAEKSSEKSTNSKKGGKDKPETGRHKKSQPSSRG